MAVKREVRARSERQLEPMWDWLHDADFSTAAVRWDNAARTVVVPFANWTDAPGFPARKRVGADPLSVSFLRPWLRGVLTVHHVRARSPPPADLVEPGMLQDLQWVADERIIRVESINEL